MRVISPDSRAAGLRAAPGRGTKSFWGFHRGAVTLLLALSSLLSGKVFSSTKVELPGARTASPGRPADDRILEGAASRIEKHRMGPVVVSVVDSAGQPVEGADVSFRQTRHEFLFGCNIFAHGRLEPAADEEAYRSRFAALFNFATLPFYWRRYEPERGRPDHAYRKAVATWCREQGITTKGHPLVWNHPASVPTWLPDDSAEVRALSEARVEDCVKRFAGLIDIWDVVNEATDPGRFRENRMTKAIEQFGAVDWTVGSFLAARRARPAAFLLINDYRTDESYKRLISRLVHDGRPVYDAIGIQSHMHGGAWTPRRAWEVCERFAGFGVPLHFTETTIVSGRREAGRRWGPSVPELEEVQAHEVAKFYTTLFSHPSVDAITWWDFADRRAWQGAPAGFLRKDLSPKPAYRSLLDLVRRRWWTDETARTDRTGKAQVRGFFGDYEIRARKGERKKLVQAKHSRKARRLELKITL